jgi:hypothetical protein
MESCILGSPLQDADDRLVEPLGDILGHGLLQVLDGHHASGGGHGQVGEAEMAVDGALGDLHLVDPLDGHHGMAHHEHPLADLDLVGIDPVAVPAEEDYRGHQLIGDEGRDEDAQDDARLRPVVGNVPLQEQVIARQHGDAYSDAYGIAGVHRRYGRTLQAAVAVLGVAVLIHFESFHF